MKYMLFCFVLIFLGCQGEDFSTSYADQDHIVDQNAYGKLEKIRFALNPIKIDSGSVPFYYLPQQILDVKFRIDGKYWGEADSVAIEYENFETTLQDGKVFSNYKPNTTVILRGLENLPDTAAVVSYYEYLIGNVKPGEHLFTIEYITFKDINQDTVKIRIDEAGELKVTAEEREKFIGIYEGGL